MDRFWEWMIEKGYDESCEGEDDYTYYVYRDMPKQMFIGWMIEYLFKHNEIIVLPHGDIEEVYEYLEKQIEAI